LRDPVGIKAEDVTMSSLSASLKAWIEKVIGTPIAEVEELTGGASRNSYIITGKSGAKSFLRLDAGHGPLSGTSFTLEREYNVLSRIQGKGVPVARVHAFSAEHNAILMEFISGYTSYQKVGSPAEEAALRRDLMAAVITLQKIDTSEIGALGDYCGAPLGVAIPADLELWKRMYDERVTIRDPLLEFAFNWLVQAIPDAETSAVIVHGDVGPGNFLVADGKIKALIDWEMTRVGHPLEDVACIIARALGAPFGEAREHVENYEKLAGTHVDYRKLDYALSLVLTRWMVGILMGLSRLSALQNLPMLFTFRHLNGIALVEALCRQNDVPLTEQPVSFRGRDPCSIVFSYGRDSLTQIAGSAGMTGADSYKLKAVVDLLSYLQSFIDYGPERYEHEEIERIARVLGRPMTTSADANEAICRHARQVKMQDARPLVEYLLWRSQREHAIMRTSLGERKDSKIRFD
jgi:aminoglycoside phosphotransferase (APT) family kinase protein